MTRFDLEGATAIVTGCSRGIGPHIAGALAARGARVAVVARTRADLDAVAERLGAIGADVIAIPADVTTDAGRHEVVERAERDLGPIDVLVNNAGGDPQREFHHLSEADIADVVELNLMSALLLSRIVLPGMLARRRGHIVNVSSMAGRTSFPHTEAYAAAKDGLIAFTRVLRGDYRSRGVSASTLILGPVRDEGVGARTAAEFGIRLPRVGLVSPPQVAKAAVRAIVADKAELAVLPGPGRALRAFMDRFPGAGPLVNRVAGANATMSIVVEHRERAARLLPASGADSGVPS